MHDSWLMGLPGICEISPTLVYPRRFFSRVKTLK